MADTRLILTIAGLELYLFRDLRASFPAHLHADPLAGLLLCGSRLFTYGSRQRLLKAGEAIALPPFMPHSCQPATADRTDWLCLLLRDTKAHDFEPVITSSAPLAPTLVKIASAIVRGGQPAPADIFSIRNFVLALPARPSMPPSTQFNFLAARLRQRPAENECLAHMAAMGNMDKFRLLRSFRAAKGLTPHRYRNSMRLAKAQELLQKGIALADCSAETGYHDQSHFSRRFKEALGVTPGAYQQAWRSPLC